MNSHQPVLSDGTMQKLPGFVIHKKPFLLGPLEDRLELGLFFKHLFIGFFGFFLQCKLFGPDPFPPLP